VHWQFPAASWEGAWMGRPQAARPRTAIWDGAEQSGGAPALLSLGWPIWSPIGRLVCPPSENEGKRQRGNRDFEDCADMCSPAQLCQANEATWRCSDFRLTELSRNE
jgi:hypothetical protein